MKINASLIHSYPFMIRPSNEPDGGGFGRVGHRRAAMSHVSCAPSSNRTCGFPASGSPIIFIRRRARAIRPDDSPSRPFDTVDIGHEGTDTPIVS